MLSRRGEEFISSSLFLFFILNKDEGNMEMPDTNSDIFEGYERKPKEVQSENSDVTIDWDAQLDRRTAKQLQEKQS